MQTTLEKVVTRVPFDQILLENRAYRFRAPDQNKDEALKGQLSLLGLLNPLILEEASPQQYIVLDGFRRLDAIHALRGVEAGWNDVPAEVIPSDNMSAADRFKILKTGNMLGDNAYSLYEKACFLHFFCEQGMSREELANAADIPTDQLLSYLELGALRPPWGPELNHLNLDISFVGPLAVRYKTWAASPYRDLADGVVQKILSHAKEEKLTMKSWHFYLDFYWSHGRPFMAAPRNPLG